jgi:type I restriction enzyme, S subunit
MKIALTLGDVLLGIEAGKSFQTSETLARDNELGVLKVSAVTWSAFRPEEAKAVIGYEPEDSHRVKAGDFLISRANTRELVGAVVLVEKDYPLRLLSDKTLRLVIDTSQADKSYLLYALRSESARKHIEHFATGTSDSMRNISQGFITSIPIKLPEIDEQRRIAAHLQAQLATVEEARQAAQAQLAEVTQLANAIVRQSLAHPDTETASLGEVLEEVKRGIGATWADYPVLGATRDGLAPAKEPVGKNPERYKPVTAGTVFYNPMRILIGSIAMVDDNDAPGITSPDYVALRGLCWRRRFTLVLLLAALAKRGALHRFAGAWCGT